MSKFIISSEYGELLDLAIHLQDEGQEVLMHIPEKDYQKIGDGIVPKLKDWLSCLGQGYIWVFDGCSRGALQEKLRERGEYVFGGSEMADKLENDRQLGQKLFKAAGFIQPKSQNFKDIGNAIKFVTKNSDKRWILKQNGDAPKSLNHMGKFKGSEDMLFHLEELQKKWNEAEFGKIDFDLMEVVEGQEIAASAFFNGEDYLKNKKGKVVGFLNIEHKKEADGDTGETTGEMGTLFFGVNESNEMFKEILMKPKILKALRAANFRGVFDINCIKTDEGIVALEPTCRFGVPATSYEFMEGLITPTHELIEGIAKGEDPSIEVKDGIGMVMVVASKPYPVEADLESGATSLGERLWILKDGEPVKEFDEEQKKHIHLENFEKADGVYKVATKNGYLFTVTGCGKTISETRENLIKYIKANIYISGMKYRSDIGEKFDGSKEKNEKTITELKKKHEEIVTSLKDGYDSELLKLKKTLRRTIYEN